MAKSMEEKAGAEGAKVIIADIDFDSATNTASVLALI